MKKIIIFILMILMSLSAVIPAGCKSSSQGGNDNPSETDPQEVVETGIDLVKAGKTNYKIVLPAEADYYEEFAASELQNIFNMATGINLTIIRDNQNLEFTGNYLSIGNTTLKSNANITVVSEANKTHGFKIVTKDSTVIMVGEDSYGTTFAVYEFLSQQFNYEFYASDEIYVDSVANAKLINFNYAYTPYVSDTKLSHALSTQEMALRYKMVLPEWSTYFPHSHFALLPPATYKAQHPEWYSGEYFICLSNTELIKEFAKNVIATIESSGNRSVCIGRQDEHGRCTCANCNAAANKYGGTSGLSIWFCKQVIDEIIELKGHDYDFELNFLAYYQDEDPPVKMENGTYVEYDTDLVYSAEERSHLAVFICLFYSDITQPLLNDKKAVKDLEGWKVYSDIYSIYNYRGFFIMDEMMYVNDWDFIADWVIQFGNYNMRQGKWDTRYPYIFFYLRAYISTQLCYNPFQSTRELVVDFINHYYKDAAPYVQMFFDGINAHMHEEKDRCAELGTNLPTLPLKSQSFAWFDEEHWPRERLVQWQGYFDLAKEALANSELSDAEKEVVSVRLEDSSIFPDYWLLKYYKDSYPATEYEQRKAEVLDTAYKLGYTSSNVFLD